VRLKFLEELTFPVWLAVVDLLKDRMLTCQLACQSAAFAVASVFVTLALDPILPPPDDPPPPLSHSLSCRSFPPQYSYVPPVQENRREHRENIDRNTSYLIS